MEVKSFLKALRVIDDEKNRYKNPTAGRNTGKVGGATRRYHKDKPEFTAEQIREVKRHVKNNKPMRDIAFIMDIPRLKVKRIKDGKYDHLLNESVDLAHAEDTTDCDI